MHKFFSRLYLAFALLVLYLPILFLIYFSFSSGNNMNSFASFSLVHYRELFADKNLLAIFLQTIGLALISGLLATIIGTGGALGVYWLKNKKLKDAALVLNNILLVSPDVIIGASLLVLFTALGISLSFVSVLLSHVAFSIPIVLLMVLPRLQQLDPTIIDAAQDLGASPSQVLSKVVLPEMVPGILTGLFMAMTYSLDDFAVTFFVTGNGFTTLSVEIYSRARQGISLEINALSTLMVLVVLLFATGYYAISKKSGTAFVENKGNLL